MKKICYLADASSPHTVKWCNFFKNRGYEVNVISLNKGEIEGVNVYSFSFDVKENKNKNAIKKIEYLKVIKEIKKIINNIKPDLLHAHYASSYGLIGSLINYKPYIISAWGTDIYEFPKNGFIQKKIIKYNLKKADYLFSTSIAMADEMKKYTDKEIKVTPFGIDMEKYKINESIRNKKKERDYKVIGTIKTLEKRYGIEYLIKAFSIVKKNYNKGKIYLKIAGDGSQLELLKDLVKELELEENVEFLGRINQEIVADTFNSFDISVFPSLKESFGVSALESQACGVPVIVTNVGGHPETVINGESGLIVEPKDEKELADAILSLIDSNDNLEKMGLIGRKYVKEKYELNKTFGEIEKIYKKIF